MHSYWLYYVLYRRSQQLLSYMLLNLCTNRSASFMRCPPCGSDLSIYFLLLHTYSTLMREFIKAHKNIENYFYSLITISSKSLIVYSTSQVQSDPYQNKIAILNRITNNNNNKPKIWQCKWPTTAKEALRDASSSSKSKVGGIATPGFKVHRILTVIHVQIGNTFKCFVHLFILFERQKCREKESQREMLHRFFTGVGLNAVTTWDNASPGRCLTYHATALTYNTFLSRPLTSIPDTVCE